MDRRAFVALPALAVATARRHEGYEYAGLVSADGPWGDMVDYVTLDGARVDNVMEADDVSGFVTIYTRARPVRREGVVRVYWKP
jgi:hypothetical protein